MLHSVRGEHVPEPALDLLLKLLDPNPFTRITADAALSCDFLSQKDEVLSTSRHASPPVHAGFDRPGPAAAAAAVAPPGAGVDAGNGAHSTGPTEHRGVIRFRFPHRERSSSS